MNSTTLTRFSVRTAASDFEALARPNITISPPHWSSVTARCCRCARSLSRRKTVIKNRIAKPKPPTAGSIKTQRVTHPCVRFTWAMICMPISRWRKGYTSGRRFHLPRQRRFHKTLFSYLDGVTWPTTRVVKKTPGRKQPNLIYQYRIAKQLPIRDGNDALKVNYVELQIRRVGDRKPTQSFRFAPRLNQSQCSRHCSSRSGTLED